MSTLAITLIQREKTPPAPPVTRKTLFLDAAGELKLVDSNGNVEDVGGSGGVGPAGPQGEKGDTGATGPEGPAGPAGASEWGLIGGTLADQTDLALALDGKQDASSALDTFATNGSAFYLARGNHTGTQLASTISDFSAASDARIAAAVGVTVQAYDANLTTWAGKTAPTGTVVGTTDAQTLTNKTITSPVLGGTVTGTYTLGGTPTFPATVVTTTGTQTLTNKTITAPVLGGTITGTYTLGGTPTFPATVVTTAGTQTLTNKTLTAPVLSGTLTGTYTIGGTPTFPATVVTTTGTQTLTNKTISGASNTITNVSLTTGITGTLGKANGGTGQTTRPKTVQVKSGGAHQIFTTGVDAKIVLGASETNDGIAWASSTATMPRDGFVATTFGFTGDSAMWFIRAKKNSTEYILVGQMTLGAGSFTAQFAVTAGDTVEFWAQQNSGIDRYIYENPATRGCICYLD